MKYVHDNTLESDVISFLRTFGIEGSPNIWPYNTTKKFPYTWSEKSMYPVFYHLFDTKENYLEFLSEYCRLVHKIETTIKALKSERNTRYYLIDRVIAQSRAATLANLATRLYWLREMSRSWRRGCISQMKKAS